MIISRSGFTLLEISIVLVIIGLLVGGILTGRDLIKAAELSATISQIQKYNTGVNTFRLKYGYLPGDIPDPQASSFGFQARGTLAGQGDSNGFIEGYGSNVFGTDCGFYEGTGEDAVFWVDLSTAGLIDGGFNTASSHTLLAATLTATSTPSLSAYFPAAKLGQGNYVYVWAGGYADSSAGNCNKGDGNNYFGLSPFSSITTNGEPYATATSLSVQQAYSIDKKIDDGLPQSGNVMAMYVNNNTPAWGSVAWAAGGGNFGAGSGSNGPTTAATPYAITNCYDNNNTAGAQQTYSLSQNANAYNCALSFKFQ
jgi:prepilin-type N-terminal cleavage/methylation domain-containing protein